VRAGGSDARDGGTDAPTHDTSLDTETAENLGYMINITDGSISVEMPTAEMNAFMSWRLENLR
jgi:hypothetical protein